MEKPTPILSDKNQFPTEEVIYAHLGAARLLWQELFDYIHTNHPDLSEELRRHDRGFNLIKKQPRIFGKNVNGTSRQRGCIVS